MSVLRRARMGHGTGPNMPKARQILEDIEAVALVSATCELSGASLVAPVSPYRQQ